MELSRRELGIHVLVHPVVGDESYMHIEVDRQADGFEELADALRDVLAQVRAAVEDWQPMRERMQALIDEPTPAGMDEDEFAEARALLAWVADHHFTFLGYREYELTESALKAVEGSGLGPAARRSAAPPRLREAAAGRARARPRARPAGARQGDQPLADPPPRVPGLHRRQEVRRRAQRDRRAALPRPLHDRRLPRGAGRTSRCCGARRRPCASAPAFPPGSHDDKALVEVDRHLPARRAVPDRRRRPLPDRVRHPRAGRAPAGAAVHAHGPLRALRVVPGVHPARPLQHRQPGQDRRDPAARRSGPSRSTGSCG